MTIKQMRPGQRVRIRLTDGRVVAMRISGMEDGKVTFVHIHGRGPSQWWLPVDYVKENAEALSETTGATE